MPGEVLLMMLPLEADALTPHLEAEGFVTAQIADGNEALKHALNGEFALVIVDASPAVLGGIGAIEFLRRVRLRSLLPVLMISTESNDAERILALELGADDYLQKPYMPQELMVRARAILRRTGSGVSVFQHLLKAGDLELDKMKRTVSKGGAEIVLTAAEFDLLELLLRRAGQVVSREEIAQVVLGRPLNHNDRSIDMHVSNLRRKLSGEESGAVTIKAIRGAGYTFTIAQ